jgi:serpin B
VEVDVKHSSIAIWAFVAAFAAACSSEEPRSGGPKADKNGGAPKADPASPKADDDGAPPAGDVEVPHVDVVRSALARDTRPQLSDVERDTFATGQATFAVDLYQTVRKQPESVDKDLFLSPHSISIALAMTYAGARTDTATEMRKTLRFALPDDRIHSAFDYVDLELAGRGKNATGRDGQPFRLNVTNSIWGQKDRQFEKPFLDTLAVNYGAGLNVVDFIGQTETSRQTINRWVEAMTEKRIKDILAEGTITADTRIVLVNAVYFNAAWATKFLESSTAPGPFTKVDKSTVQVPMMHGTASRPYAKGDGYEAVELPYDGGELSLLVIAPTAGTFAAFESTLTGGKVLDIRAGLQAQQVKLAFPKLKLEGDFGLKAPLQAMGMENAFTDAADFSGMSTAERLKVKDVVHKTFVDIDENGTEAAAATAVVGVTTSLPPPPIEVNIDRPFIMAIVDHQTKALVFLGRILEPKL